jgi:hypothetical protein
MTDTQERPVSQLVKEGSIEHVREMFADDDREKLLATIKHQRDLISGLGPEDMKRAVDAEFMYDYKEALRRIAELEIALQAAEEREQR